MTEGDSEGRQVRPSNPDLNSGRETPLPHRFRREQEELELWIRETPSDATVKGMFVESFLKTLDRAGQPRPTDKRYVAFKDYPLPSLMRMSLNSVNDIWPHLPPREGLRLLGQSVYPTLIESTVGKVMFSIAGRSWITALTLTEKAFGLSLSPGRAKLVDLTERGAKIELRDIWNFTDCYQVGVMEGAMKEFQVVGTVTPRRRGRRCDVDLLLEWQQR